MTEAQHPQAILRLGDALILGQRLSAWCGHGPILEEDIALTNVALDLVARPATIYAGRDSRRTRSRRRRPCLLPHRPRIPKPPARQSPTVTLAIQWCDRCSTMRSPSNATSSSRAKRSTPTLRACRQSREGTSIPLGPQRPVGDPALGRRHRRESHARRKGAWSLWSFAGEMFMADDTDRACAQAGLLPGLTEKSKRVDESRRAMSFTGNVVDARRGLWMSRGKERHRAPQLHATEMQVLPQFLAAAGDQRRPNHACMDASPLSARS